MYVNDCHSRRARNAQTLLLVKQFAPLLADHAIKKNGSRVVQQRREKSITQKAFVNSETGITLLRNPEKVHE